MNFDLTEDQVQIRETVRRLMADRYTAALRNSYRNEDVGWSTALWRAYAEMGLTALHVPAEYGGLAGGADDQYVVMRELGRAAILEPYIGSCVAAATAIALGGSQEQRQRYLPRIASGELVCAWANQAGAGRELRGMRATSSVNGWHLTGTSRLVLHAASATCLIASASVDDSMRAALFLVPADTPGLRLRSYRLVDGSSAADIEFDDVAAVPLGPADSPAGENVIYRTESMCIAAVCAEAVGAMHAAFDLTVTYLNMRTQFGKPLASNQALRHRCADMMVLLECSESMAMLAAITLSDPESCEPHDLQAARTVITRYGRSLCEQAIQLHGGIGMTEEYGVGRYLQRLMVIEQLFTRTAALSH